MYFPLVEAQKTKEAKTNQQLSPSAPLDGNNNLFLGFVIQNKSYYILCELPFNYHRTLSVLTAPAVWQSCTVPYSKGSQRVWRAAHGALERTHIKYNPEVIIK